MILNIFLISLLILGLLTLIWLFWKKIPQLRILDPESLPEERTKRLKHDLIRQRVTRAGSKPLGSINKQVVKPLGTGLQNFFRRVAGKLTAVERRYQEKQKQTSTGKYKKEALHDLVEEGKKLMDEELWDRAEKKFIDVIGVDSKNIESYESLGRLYLAKKDYQSAKETFEFLAKLSKGDPSVIASVGEVAEKLGEDEVAFRNFKKAVELSPKNPKYLDFLITAAIKVKDWHEAQSAIDRLKEVNPDNNKIAAFEAEIKESRQTK